MFTSFVEIVSFWQKLNCLFLCVTPHTLTDMILLLLLKHCEVELILDQQQDSDT